MLAQSGKPPVHAHLREPTNPVMRSSYRKRRVKVHVRSRAGMGRVVLCCDACRPHHAVEPARDPSTDGAELAVPPPPCLPSRSDGCGTGGGRQPPPSDELGPAVPFAVPLACSVDGERLGSEPEAALDAAAAARSQGCGRHE